MPEVRSAASAVLPAAPPAAWLRFVETWIDRWLAGLILPPDHVNAAEVMRLGL